MRFSRRLRTWTCVVLTICLVEVGPGIREARAVMISTEAALSGQAADARARLRGALAREDVQRELARLGVDVAEARARVDALSDAEAELVAARLDDLPAGGNALVGVVTVIAVVFLILILTDALGITDLFPWVKGPDQR